MALAEKQRLICDASALAEGGRGIRFTVDDHGHPAAAFAIRYDNKVYAYLNSCAHVPIELDWMEGEFFDRSGLYLICATHGATYDPATGQCIMGPCKGQRLTPVTVEEHGGNVYMVESENKYG